MIQVQLNASRAAADLDDLQHEVPAWLKGAMDVPRQAGHCDVDGTDIHFLEWGPANAPLLVLLHGRMSHSRCWAFIAPLLADRYRCIAIDFSGMGDSGWRERYTVAERVHEVATIIETRRGRSPVLIVTHSYGAVVGAALVNAFPDTLSGLIACDPSLEHPDDWSTVQPRTDGPALTRPGRVYPDLATAVSRFRFAPPQPDAQPVLAEFIARHSLRETDNGWAWKFDPHVYSPFEEGHNDWWVEHSRNLANLDAPKALIVGAQSLMVTPSMARAVASRSSRPMPVAAIPGAAHHLMADQPAALAACIDGFADVLLR